MKIMTTKASEIFIRHQTKLVLKYLENEDLQNAREIILNNKDILQYNFGLINFVPLIPRIRFSKRIPRNNEALKMVIDAGFQIFLKENNVNELLFFAAAKCDTETLKSCIKKIQEMESNNLNQVREGDTVLMFLIKYGNIADEKYPECMKILVDAGVDVNRNDYFFHNPILFLSKLYERYTNRTKKDEAIIENLKKCIQLLIDTKKVDLSLLLKTDVTKTFSNFDLSSPHDFNSEETKQDKLFKYLINNDEESFIKSEEISQLLDADDGSNTFLQLCCEKNLKKAAIFLIEKGADLCKTTIRNPQTPLEMAARRNHWEIFEELLKTNKIIINQEIFLKFLRSRPKHIKAKYFDEILKYKHLDVNIRSNNGNTPLHYAIIFSSSEAVITLLQRGASLLVKNDSNKCPLDYISAEDLENYLNKCIVLDRYNDIHNGKYELALNFRNLVDSEDSNMITELAVVEKICNSSKLCSYLNHPLLSSFLDIKWKLIEPIYQKFFIFHVFFYCISILSFINLNLLNYLALPLFLIYSIKIWSTFNWSRNKLHEIVDISIAIIIFLTFFISNNIIRYQLGITATIFMAFSFHLFWRFSPDFSQFHALLVNILTQLFSYLFYILSLILFFGAARHIFLLVHHEQTSHNFFMQMQVSPYFYLLYLFGIFVGVIILMTVINLVTYLQQNSENLKNNFQALGYRNTLIFLQSIEKLYVTVSFIGNPFIFDEFYLKESEVDVKCERDISKRKLKKSNKSKNKYLVNFYININKFSFEKLCNVKLTDVNVAKIRNLISR